MPRSTLRWACTKPTLVRSIWWITSMKTSSGSIRRKNLRPAARQAGWSDDSGNSDRGNSGDSANDVSPIWGGRASEWLPAGQFGADPVRMHPAHRCRVVPSSDVAVKPALVQRGQAAAVQLDAQPGAVGHRDRAVHELVRLGDHVLGLPRAVAVAGVAQ